MANKKQPLLIEPRDFHVFLASRMALLGGGVAALAEFLGVGPATAYQLLSGALRPSDEVLKKSGLRVVYVMDIQVPDEDAPPVKSKKK